MNKAERERQLYREECTNLEDQVMIASAGHLDLVALVGRKLSANHNRLSLTESIK